METVKETVEDFMRNMLGSGGSYEKDMRVFVTGIVNERLREELGSLFGSIDIFSKSKTVPQKADADKRTARFRTTIRQETLERMKSLDGTFGDHVQAAFELYLNALVGLKNDAATGK